MTKAETESDRRRIVAALSGAFAASRELDSPDVLHAMLAILRADDARREATKKGLTRTQKRRVAKRLEGQSIRAIANAEGRAPSTVAESLAAPSVRAYIAARLRIMRAGDQPIFDLLLERLADLAFNATRPGPGYMVPDNRVRFDAILKLLHYYDPGDGGATSERATPSTRGASEAIGGSEPIPALPSTDDTPGVTQTVIERSLTATERRAVTRTIPVQNAPKTRP